MSEEKEEVTGPRGIAKNKMLKKVSFDASAKTFCGPRKRSGLENFFVHRISKNRLHNRSAMDYSSESSTCSDGNAVETQNKLEYLRSQNHNGIAKISENLGHTERESKFEKKIKLLEKEIIALKSGLGETSYRLEKVESGFDGMRNQFSRIEEMFQSINSNFRELKENKDLMKPEIEKKPGSHSPAEVESLQIANGSAVLGTSYADITRKLIQGQIKNKTAIAPGAVQEFLATSSKVERQRSSAKETKENQKLKAIYIQGFGSTMTIRKIKDHLFNMKFMISKVRHIRYVGQTTVEFLIEESYSNRFRERFLEMSTHFTVLDEYNLLQNPWQKDPSPTEIKQKIIRITQKIVKATHSSSDEKVAGFFNDIIDSMGSIAKQEALKYAKEELKDSKSNGDKTHESIKDDSFNNEMESNLSASQDVDGTEKDELMTGNDDTSLRQSITKGDYTQSWADEPSSMELIGSKEQTQDELNCQELEITAQTQVSEILVNSDPENL